MSVQRDNGVTSGSDDGSMPAWMETVNGELKSLRVDLNVLKLTAATKVDLAETTSEVLGKLAEVSGDLARHRAETKHEFESQRAETKHEFELQRAETKHEFDLQRAETKHEFDLQRAETREAFERHRLQNKTEIVDARSFILVWVTGVVLLGQLIPPIVKMLEKYV